MTHNADPAGLMKSLSKWNAPPKRIAAALLAVSLGVGSVLAGAAVYAQAASAAAPPAAPANTAPATTAPAPATALDPALQRMFMRLATALLTNFTASAASGSFDGFDPGPALESTLKTVLASRELHTALERLADQAGRGVEGSAADGVAPEMRALMRAALSGAVALARNEIARELAGPQAAPVLNP